MGYENNIAMVPIAAVTSLALGGDLMLAAAIAVGGITVGASEGAKASYRAKQGNLGEDYQVVAIEVHSFRAPV